MIQKLIKKILLFKVTTVRQSSVFARVNRIVFSEQGNKFGVSDGDGNVSLWQANNTAQILQSTAAFASLHNASINVGNSFNQFPSLFNQITSGIGAKGGLGGLGGQAFQTLGGMFSGGGYGGGVDIREVDVNEFLHYLLNSL